MYFFIFLFVGLLMKQSQTRPSQNISEDVVEAKDYSIPEINNGKDFTDGDILQGRSRSAISDNEYRWKTPVPYIFDASLDINAKGVIMKAFDQFGVKTCIDFKLRDTEQSYISFEKDNGCFSYVGNDPGRSGQILSIGEYCDHIAIVEHEVLHALGFWHEQSRHDRDEYVRIVWENIIEGNEHNFKKEFENETTTQGTPYDYDSVMHYGQYDFSNGNGTTIITKLPEFQNRIGQRLDMSHYDVVELNRLYNCTSSVALVERCSFENGTCQMSLCSRSNVSWSSESSIPGGPHSGHTSLGVSEGPSTVPTSEPSTPAPSGGPPSSPTNGSITSAPYNITGPTSSPSNESSTSAPYNITGPTSSPSNESSTSAPYNITGEDIFMHFSTASGVEGDRAIMETRRWTPRRNCSVQCLQFFYYHSGNESDQLNIWIREFDDEYDTGTLRLVWQITGLPADYWQLQHVPLNASKMFQVEFEGRKGEGRSVGGFSIDDINLSETECPHQTLQIRNVEQLSASGTVLFSPRYFSTGGYGYQILARVTPYYTAAYVRLVSGENDDLLQWPCPWRQITILMLDQNPDIQQRMSKQFSFTTDPTSSISFLWDDPQKRGVLFNDSYGESYYVNQGYGLLNFMTLEQMKEGGFIKGGDIFFLVSMQDISELRFNSSLECNTMLPPQNFSSDRVDDGPCMPLTRPRPTTEAPANKASSPIQVSSSVMVILMAWALLWSH